MERDVERQIVLLAAATHENSDDKVGAESPEQLTYTVPKIVRRIIQAARSSARGRFRASPNGRCEMIWCKSRTTLKTLAMLALIHAAVGEKNEALGAATRAGELLPIAKDSFDGPILRQTLVAISAKLGEKDLAIRRLESLVGVPNGPTPGTLRVGTRVGFFTRRSPF